MLKKYLRKFLKKGGEILTQEKESKQIKVKAKRYKVTRL